MIRAKIFWVNMVLMVFCGGGAIGQTHRFDIQASETPVLPMPLSIDLDGIEYDTDGKQIRLYQISRGSKNNIPCQLESGVDAKLWFVPEVISANQKVQYEICLEDSQANTSSLSASMDETEIALGYNDKNILSFHHAVCPAPDGVNPLYQRSGFIHPLHSPSGMVLTRIQPSDHYHHYGIWNPWTKTHVEGAEVDFWNLAKGQGTVRFSGLLSTSSGAVYSGFKVHKEHVVLKPTEKIAMNEVFEVRAFASQVDNKPVWVIDYTTTLNNALSDVIELVNYRYGGGIGFRATEKWTNQNCTVLTSEGKTRKDADGTGARWCDVNGAGNEKGQPCGILFMSHPTNRSHPEPMRVWPEDATGGTGEMFFEFCPIRHQSWDIEPGNDYVLRYRMIVYDGKIAPETSENLWNHFAKPPVVVRNTD